MPKYALEFSKTGYMIYTSHLDMVRLFKRVFTRAGLALTYSQGYNPHPRMSFAVPLPLGYASLGEWVSFRLDEEVPPERILELLKPAMPEGISLISCKELGEGKETLSGLCEAAEYEIRIPKEKVEDRWTEETAVSFLSQPEILIEKKAKKGKKRIWVTKDIRPMILSLRIEEVDNNYIMFTTLEAGSQSNLSPEHLITAFFRFTEQPLPREYVAITRVRLIFQPQG